MADFKEGVGLLTGGS